MARSDDMTPELIAEAAKRPPAPEAEEILRRSRLLVQQEASGQTEQDVKPDPQREAVAATVKPSVYSETGRALLGGVRDAGQEVLDFVDDSANWLNDNFINLRTAQQDADYKAGKSKGFGGEKGALALPEVAKNETTAGNIARSVTQFTVPFLGYLKAFSKVGATSKLVKSVEGAAAGAATDADGIRPASAAALERHPGVDGP
jgi:hypothetical protein